MEARRRRVASLAALGGAIGALVVDVLYVNLISEQGTTPPGGRVPLVAAWIGVAALLAAVGAFTRTPERRAWLLGASAAGLLVVGVPALFSIGTALLVCGAAVAVGAFRAARQLDVRAPYLFLAPIAFVAVAAAALAAGFILTGP